MQPTYENNLIASLFLYAEHTVAQELVAYQSVTTRLFPTVDPSIPSSYRSYSSPLKGFLYDSGISGAVIINSVSGGGFSAPLTRASGIFIDYPNGRVLVPAALGSNLVLTGTASYPELRTYTANETEEAILTQGKYFVNPRFVSPLTASGAPPNTYATPAVFIAPLATHNRAYQLGGTVETKVTMTMTVLAESPYQLSAMLSLWGDKRYSYFPLVPIAADPLNQWGDTKSGFNYKAVIAQYGTPGNLVYIEDVRTARVSDRVKFHPQLFVGIIDVDTCFVRS